jgi:hypothetical protein
MSDPQRPDDAIVVLNDEVREGTHFSEHVGLRSDGTLAFTGFDSGALPTAVVGAAEYEWIVTVDERHRNRLLLLLLAERFGGSIGAIARFQEWAKERHIATQQSSWRGQ